MSDSQRDIFDRGTPGDLPHEWRVYEAEVVPEPPSARGRYWPVPRRRVGLPLMLFVLTCLSTLFIGTMTFGDHRGWQYALPVMIILLCHESGHFIQAWRYGVHCSLPMFLPLPVPPFGTLGAVIFMEPRVGDRKAIFDIGISGPLSGLIPTLIFSAIGLSWSSITTAASAGHIFGEPFLFQVLAGWFLGPIPEGMTVYVHPMAFAGWVGLFITALNLMPIGQLDGGHILYCLLRRKAYPLARAILIGAMVTVFLGTIFLGLTSLLNWLVMIMLLFLIGPEHPPTSDDRVPLGVFRIILGWLTLGFILVGFTPFPFPGM